ncbi:hypothetical protein HNQ91_000789 [Filimonas zeae]|uniref:SIMPL domain-containing protein n=1 Tax=Filimonas zeae TaxID=1737353 RepID=A0A917MS59_9BACT|nr:SIMPL domain-containing protein [Filimonas zeae]MDR6337767.1 hypothetical protein [Filimonas zeae]GGH60165.1 hypothetical protein GCM10011379_07720 [Filimonas zeae]
MKQPITACAILCLLAIPAFSQTKNFIDLPYISVNGNADTLITPNEIFIKITLSEKDTRDKISLEAQEAKMVEGLKSLGINTETDLTTSDIISNYRFYLLKQKDIIKSKEYMLKVNTAALAGKVFVKLEDLDLSNAWVDHVNHTELEKLAAICRANAMLVARERANALAAPVNQRVGKVIYIHDNNTEGVQGAPGDASRIMIRGYGTYTDKAKYEPPKIEFEKIRININIQVNFMLQQ